MSTIRINGRNYDVTVNDPTADRGLPRYELRGPRGAHYGTLRNYRETQWMMLVNLRGGRLLGVDPLPGCRWLTDARGVLETQEQYYAAVRAEKASARAAEAPHPFHTDPATDLCQTCGFSQSYGQHGRVPR